jgi:hypothetical protein
MPNSDTERELQQPTRYREQAAEYRCQAERLGRAGYHDQAARHLLEARLNDLEAAAYEAVSRVA